MSGRIMHAEEAGLYYDRPHFKNMDFATIPECEHILQQNYFAESSMKVI